jgi:hypothetical protein
MHEELARRGLTLESWAASWRARAEEVLEEERRALRARRARRVKIGAAAAIGLSAAAAVTVAVVEAGRLQALRGVDVHESLAPNATPPDAGREPGGAPQQTRSTPPRR